MLQLLFWGALVLFSLLVVLSCFPTSVASASVPFRPRLDWPIEAAIISMHQSKAKLQAERAQLKHYKVVQSRNTQTCSLYGSFKFGGEIGCAEAHMAAIDLLVPKHFTLVLEDDVHFVPDYQRKLAKILQELTSTHPNWTMLRLGSSQYFPPVTRYAVQSFVKDNTGTCGMFAVLYNPQHKAKLQQFLRQHSTSAGKPTNAVDRLFCTRAFCSKFETFTCCPALAIPDVSESLIRGHRDPLTHSLKMRWDLTCFPSYPLAATRHFTVVVPSYNNEDWVCRNLTSVFEQTYANFSIVYVDDHSSDRTAQLAGQLMAGKSNCTYLRNSAQMGQAYSRMQAYTSCPITSTCFFLDGDDWLAHKDVLRQVGVFMDVNQADMVYNSFAVSHHGQISNVVNLTRDYSALEKKNKDFRNLRWRAPHPRVFETHLLRHITADDLVFEDKWLTCCTDLAESFVCLEHARNPLKLVLPQRAYVYNKDNSVRYSNSFYNVHNHPDQLAYRVRVEKFVRQKKKVIFANDNGF